MVKANLVPLDSSIAREIGNQEARIWKSCKAPFFILIDAKPRNSAQVKALIDKPLRNNICRQILRIAAESNSLDGSFAQAAASKVIMMCGAQSEHILQCTVNLIPLLNSVRLTLAEEISKLDIFSFGLKFCNLPALMQPSTLRTGQPV